MIDFEEAVSNPESWFRQSWEMFHASKALYEMFQAGGAVRDEEYNYRRVGSLKGALLLLGFSVENALKGAHVFRVKPNLSRGRMDPKDFSEHSHHLLQIANNVDLHLTDPQIDLLERLTHYIQWSSRYQAPLRKSEHENPQARIRLKPADYHLALTLILELQSQSGYGIECGWPRP